MTEYQSSEPNHADLRNLSSCMTGGRSGFTFWHYQTQDGTGLKDVRKPLFFKDATKMLRVGDMVAVSASDTCAILYVRVVQPDFVITRPLGD
jgi:hypothetical protein